MNFHVCTRQDEFNFLASMYLWGENKSILGREREKGINKLSSLKLVLQNIHVPDFRADWSLYAQHPVCALLC